MQKNTTTQALKKEDPKPAANRKEQKVMTIDGIKVFVDELEGEEDKLSIDYQLTQTGMEDSNLQISEETNQEKLYKLLDLQK